MHTILHTLAKPLAIAATTASLALFGSSAFAHAHVEKTIPEANSTVSTVSQVCAEFGSPLEPAFSNINVFDSNDKQVNQGKSAISNENKTICVAAAGLEPGDYVAKWVAVAADGHRINGDFSFTVQ